jgi:type IV secretory pathway component VirB8
MKKGLLILILCAIVLTAASVIAVTVLVPLIRYNQADVVLNEGRY